MTDVKEKMTFYMTVFTCCFNTIIRLFNRPCLKFVLLAVHSQAWDYVGISIQSRINCFSVDSKRSLVRTIEVRPMAQLQPKQLTATVMPTTSQSEPQEAVAAAEGGCLT